MVLTSHQGCNPDTCVHLQKCIAHRVAKLYGLETLTVSNSENTPSVGVRRTRKSVHIPAVHFTLPGLCNLPLQPSICSTPGHTSARQSPTVREPC